MAKLRLISLSCDVPECIIPAVYEVSIDVGWMPYVTGKFCEPHAGQELAKMEVEEMRYAR